MKTLIRNARMITPGLELPCASALIDGNRIIATAAGDPGWNADQVIDAKGMMLCPGFIDLHCHGRNNFDFCDGSDEAVQVIARGKLEEGVTSMLPTTLTVSPADLEAALTAVSHYDQSGARILGVHLEGPFINSKCAGAQNPAFVRKPDMEEVKRLNAIFPVSKVTAAVECEGAVEAVSEMLNMGIVPSCTHSAATLAEFEAAYHAGMRNLSHFCNQMSPLHHRDIGLVGAGLLYKDVFVELICDKLHISPAMIKLVFQCKGAEHVILISDAMRAAGMPDGEYSLGGLPVIVRDGAARLKEGGALAGSTLQIATAFRNVCEVTGLPPAEVVAATGLSAAVSLGITDLGRIAPGFLADLVLLDDSFNIEFSMVGGEIRYRRS